MSVETIKHLNDFFITSKDPSLSHAKFFEILKEISASGKATSTSGFDGHFFKSLNSSDIKIVNDNIIELFKIAMSFRYKELMAACATYINDSNIGITLEKPQHSSSIIELNLDKLEETNQILNEIEPISFLEKIKDTIEYINFSNQESLDEVFQKDIIFPNITAIELSFPMTFDNNITVTASSAKAMCPNAKKLYLPSKFEPENPFIWNNIETLVIGTKPDQSKISKSFPNLKLCMFLGQNKYCKIKSDQGIVYVAASLPQKNQSNEDLREIRLTDAAQLVTDELAIETIKNFDRPTTFNFNNCDKLTDKIIKDISKDKVYQQKLTRLYLNECTNLQNIQGISKLRDLRELTLDKCYRLTTDSIDAIAKCTKLKILTLDGCTTLTNEHIKQFEQLTELRTLRIARLGPDTGEKITDQAILSLVNKLPHLKEFNVKNQCFSSETRNSIFNKLEKNNKKSVVTTTKKSSQESPTTKRLAVEGDPNNNNGDNSKKAKQD